MNRKLIRTEGQQYTCEDCGTAHDTFILKPGVWRKADLGLLDCCCQPCVEKRLGRKLRKQDFLTHIISPTAVEASAKEARDIEALDEAVHIRRQNQGILENVLQGDFPGCEVRIEEAGTFVICDGEATRFKTNPTWLRERIKVGELI